MVKITYEGVVENGKVKLEPQEILPEHAKVLVVILEPAPPGIARIPAPRLVQQSQVLDFEMQVTQARK